MSIIDLFVLGLATSSLVTIWFQENGLFAGLRALVEAWGEYTPGDIKDGVPAFWPVLKHKLSQGINCKLCMTVQCATLLGIVFYAPHIACPTSTLCNLFVLPVYILGACRIAAALL